MYLINYIVIICRVIDKYTHPIHYGWWVLVSDIDIVVYKTVKRLNISQFVDHTDQNKQLFICIINIMKQVNRKN